MNKTGLERRYSKIAHLWKNDVYKNIRRDDLIPIIISLLNLSDIKNDEIILDVMCGSGIVGLSILKETRRLKKNNQVYFLDYSQEMLDQINKDQVKILSDARNIPLPNGSVSRVIVRNALHDIDEFTQTNVLKEIFRILKCGGKLILMGYYTNLENQKMYNYVVNLKDQMSGNLGDYERYFPTKKEYLYLLESAGFYQVKIKCEFLGNIVYESTSELKQGALKEWRRQMNAMLELEGSKMNYILEKGKLKFIFPGVIFSATKQ